MLILDPDDAWLKNMPKNFAKDNPLNPVSINKHLQSKARCMRYVPSLPGWDDVVLSNLYRECMIRKGIIIYHDETIGLVSDNQYPDGFLEVWSRGRKHGVAGWCASQRAFGIPKIIISQSEHLVCFKVDDEDDKIRMAKAMVQPAINTPRNGGLKKYEFWYYNNSSEMEAGVKCPPMKLVKMSMKGGEK